jgi:thiol-disulfide isomerase/thioredoxin
MKTTRMLRDMAALSALAATLVLGGCSTDPLAEQFRSGDNKQYIAGDGSVTEFQNPATRLKGKAWAGYSETGVPVIDRDLLGNVVVLNFWYAGCAPCRAEAPALQQLKEQYSAQEVVVLGVNVRDSADTAKAFNRSFKLNYPSIIDAGSGNVLLAFTGIVTPQAVPTTLVLDKLGRVSARILGRFDPATLRALVKTALSEK